MAVRRRRVVWSASASAALDEAIAYIARNRRQAAVDVLERALQAAETLSTLSDRGRIVPELGDPDARDLFVHQYRLMYRVEDLQVIVFAFLHGARDFEAWRRSQS